MPATEYLTTPTRTPRSAWAAALANLTGLGLGYAYLRRPLHVVAAVVGTLGLVVVAFVTDASSAPWLWRAVAAVWLGAQTVDGARIARRGPRPARGTAPLPVGVTPLRLQITGATAADVTVPGCPSCPASLPRLDTCPSPGGKPTQDVRLAGGLYHVLLQPTGSRRMTVRTLTAVDGTDSCVYAVPAGPSI